MEAQEINEGNKLIAEFLGLKPHKSNSGPMVNKNVFSINGREYLVDNLEYHSLWDWIMLAVDKIEDLPTESGNFGHRVYIHNNSSVIQSLYRGRYDDISYCYDSNHPNKYTKIEMLWLCVVEFIKWHNQQNKK